MSRLHNWLGRPSVVRLGHAARKATGPILRVTAQGLTRSRLAGAQLARHIIAVQQAAGLNAKLAAESLRSVANRSRTRESDKAWADGYVRQAEALAARAPAEPAITAQPVPARTMSARTAAPAADREAGS